MKRSGSFGELIYTRCGPGYSIRGEALPANNGYGIFNLSEGLWAELDESALQFAERVVVRQYQWTYGCPVKKSWSYLRLPGSEECVFADLYQYTDEDRANNTDASNMRGTHVAQMLSGVPTMYPFEMIDSPHFQSRQQASTDVFYRDDCAAKLEQVAQEQVLPGPVTREAIRDFLNGARVPLAQACTAWLIRQMEKPESERRPIVILDAARNIPLWIGAITCGLPVTLSRQVPFYTCREGVEKPARAVFYRVKKDTGEYVPKIDMQDPTQESRPLAMLVGCAKEDEEAARSVAALSAESPCVLLDGLKNAVNFTPEEQVLSSAFIQNASKTPSVHEALLDFMEEMTTVPFSGECVAVYNALLALTAKVHPSLAELTGGLKVLRPYASARHRCIRRILNSLIEQRDYAESYVKQDASSGFALLSEMIHYAAGQPEFAEKLAALTTECLKDAASNASSVFPALWKQIRANKFLERDAVEALVGKEQMEFVAPKAVKAMPESNCAALLEMQDSYIRLAPDASWTETVSRPVPAISEAIRRSVQLPGLRSQMIGYLRGEPRAMEIYIVGGATLTGSTAAQRAPWWDVFLGEGCNAEQLSKVILSSHHFGGQDLEQLLVCAIRQKGITDDTRRAYERNLASDAECGEAFFREALQYTLAKEGALPESLDRLWSMASNDANAKERMREILTGVDNAIDFVPNAINEKLASFVSSHIKGPGKSRGQTYVFLSRMTRKSASGLRRQRQSLLDQWQEANSAFTCQFVNEDLSKTQMGQALLAKARDNAGEMASILLIIGGFRFPDKKDHQSWMKAYSSELVADGFTPKDNPLAALCALKALLHNRGGHSRNEIGAALSSVAKQTSDEYLRTNLDIFISQCVKALSKDRKTAQNAEKMVKACRENFGSEAAGYLQDALDQAIEEYQSGNKLEGNSLGKIFGSLFGRKK